jgi:hypothetical protein
MQAEGQVWPRTVVIGVGGNIAVMVRGSLGYCQWWWSRKWFRHMGRSFTGALHVVKFEH